MDNYILDIKNLSISFFENKKENIVLNNFNFCFKKNITTAVVGPSGCGKSVLSLACLNLLNHSKKLNISGNIFYKKNKCVLNLNKKESLLYRGIYTSIIFQDPFTSLNPVLNCKYQLSECIKKKHPFISEDLLNKKLYSVLKKVELKNPNKILSSYPHELSGGQLQRILICFSLIFESKLIIADEVTTALDPYVKNKILMLLKKICYEKKISLFLVSHDINVVKKFSDEIIILKDGSIIESGKTNLIFKNPKNYFTKSLIICKPKITNNSFFLPYLKDNKIIKEKKILFKKSINKNILELKNLSIYYKKYIALNNINIKIKENDIIGIIGRSGSGKSTLSKIICLIEKKYSGQIFYKKQNFKTINNKILNKKIQLVFQNPESSLNPNQKIINCLKEVLIVNKINKEQHLNLIYKKLKEVDLEKNILNKYPHELSGGQKQRISITRILLSDPEIIIFDESVSALDINSQAYVLNLIKKIYIKNNLTIIYISHDISTVSFLCNKIFVLKKGKIVDSFETINILKSMRNKETKKLINNN